MKEEFVKKTCAESIFGFIEFLIILTNKWTGRFDTCSCFNLGIFAEWQRIFCCFFAQLWDCSLCFFGKVLCVSEVRSSLLRGAPAVNSPQRETQSESGRWTDAGGHRDQCQPEGIIGHFLCFVPSSCVTRFYWDRQSAMQAERQMENN